MKKFHVTSTAKLVTIGARPGWPQLELEVRRFKLEGAGANVPGPGAD
jgi:hypothetical protein